MRSKYIETPDVDRLKACLTPAEWLPLWLSLETGLRIGDVVALRVSNVKPDGIHFKAQKTGKVGVAKISDRLRRELPKRGKWLFPSPSKRGKHLTRQAAWARVKAAGRRAGLDLEGLSPHTMRKVFAVELYRQKGFVEVQKALQHNNSATTEIYSFADWNTGENADLPLKRRDLQLVVRMCLEALGVGNDNKGFQKESKKKTT
jgi:integrase